MELGSYGRKEPSLLEAVFLLAILHTVLCMALHHATPRHATLRTPVLFCASMIRSLRRCAVSSTHFSHPITHPPHALTVHTAARALTHSYTCRQYVTYTAFTNHTSNARVLCVQHTRRLSSLVSPGISNSDPPSPPAMNPGPAPTPSPSPTPIPVHGPASTRPPRKLSTINSTEVHTRGFSSRRRRPVFRLLGVGALVLGALAVYNNYNESDRSLALGVMKSLPLRFLSRCWGSLHSIELPVFLRAAVYNLWTYVFGCNLEEMRDPLESYVNLSQFFIRHLKDGVRPIDNADIVSPADSLVTVMGKITKSSDNNNNSNNTNSDNGGSKNQFVLQQIKGMDYSLEEFIGESLPSSVTSNPNSSLYYIVFYLAPGDYHRFHSSSDVLFKKRIHFPGHLFPVAPSIARYVPDLFIRNERIILTGEWKHGFYSFIPVGAYNVGSVKLNYDENLITNRRHHRKQIKYAKKSIQDDVRENSNISSNNDNDNNNNNNLNTRAADTSEDTAVDFVRYYGADEVAPSGDIQHKNNYTNKSGLLIKKGTEIGRFELGSTVVLVFETGDKDLVWNIKEGDKVKMGQAVATLTDKNNNNKEKKQGWF